MSDVIIEAAELALFMSIGLVAMNGPRPTKGEVGMGLLVFGWWTFALDPYWASVITAAVFCVRAPRPTWRDVAYGVFMFVGFAAWFAVVEAFL